MLMFTFLSMSEGKVVPHFKALKPRYFFKEWRKYRGLTQEQLAERVNQSAASVSQLERGKQGFTDATLAAYAEALTCSPGDLLMRNPLDTEAPWSLWEQMKPAQRRQAVAVLEAIVRTGTSD